MPACRARFRLALAASLACAMPAWAVNPETGSRPDGQPTYEQFAARVKTFPYVASPERARVVRSGAHKLTLCMDKATVLAVLGAPDYSSQAWGPKGPAEKFLGHSWSYALTKQKLANDKDEHVTISFDANGRAHWVYAVGIEGFTALGDPRHHCP
jgi:hypothetical protein